MFEISDSEITLIRGEPNINNGIGKESLFQLLQRDFYAAMRILEQKHLEEEHLKRHDKYFKRND